MTAPHTFTNTDTNSFACLGLCALAHASRSFVVLVAGTVVYGRGDEEAAKAALSSAVSDALSAPTTAAAAALDEAPLLTAPLSVPADPVLVSQPIVVRGSFKSTMTMVSGSYSRSFTRSSLPRGSLAGRIYHPTPSRDSDSAA